MSNIIRIVITVTLALSLVACEKPPEQAAGPRPALVMTVQNAGAKSKVAIVGEIKSRYISEQGFRVAGKITKRYVDVGDIVKKGQVLAKLDNNDAKLALQANQADINAAKARVALAKANLARQTQLLEKKFISAAALDRYQTEYKTAQARLAQAKAQTSVTKNQSSYTRLYADRSGIVSMIEAEPGRVVVPGVVVAKIIALKHLEVHIPVAESRMKNVKIGDIAVMRLWADRDKAYAVKVREIAPVADTITRTFLVKLTIVQPDESIRLGMTAGVILRQAVEDAMLIPSPAVIKKNNQTIVWLVGEDNTVHAQQVHIVSYREDGILIQSGLDIGDKVIVAGAEVLTEGQLVRPVESR